MYAVIKTGGKQYKVAPDDVVLIEKLVAAAGETVSFGDVLMIGGEGEVKIGAPLLAGASVSGEVLAQEQTDKVLTVKKKRRHNYRRKIGHRQEVTRVKITGING